MVHILQHALKRFKVRLIRLLAVHLCLKTGFFFKKEFIETFFRDSQSVFSFHKIKVLIKGQKKNGFAFPVDYHITKTLEVHYILPTGVRNRL